MSFPKRLKYEITSLQLDEELKNLAVKFIRTEKGVENVGHLAKLKTYEIYHKPLEHFFKTKYNRKPTQTDNLAFILLLSYPERMILQFTSFKDLKLAFNNPREESDFDSIGFEIGTHEEENTCICNEPIKNIHIFRNKFSGMTFQIGSVCNERYCLISKQDQNYKSTCKKIKEHKEKEKERNENLPEGYFENERKQKKEKKIENTELKLMKEEDKHMKRIEKEIKTELKELNKSGLEFYIPKNCYFCKRYGIYKSTDKIGVCSTCSPSNQKKIKININFEIKKALEECLNCDKIFVNTTKESSELCRICKKIVKINKCKMCKSQFILGLNKNDMCCDVCDENLINCLHCKREILKQQSQNLRCYKCNHNYINKIEVKTCEYCYDEFEIGEKEKWKTCCSECYLDNRTLQKCDSCDDYFTKMKNETWKKVCKSCYYKNKK